MNRPSRPRTNELERMLRATGHSLRGIARVWRDEAAFRSEVFVLLVLVPLAAWLADNLTEFTLLVGVWLLVIAGELGNSAIEATVDRIGMDHHDLSGKAKDAASAMVMVLLLLAGLVWCAMLYARLTA